MEKPWRLYLANSAIQHLDIIAGDPALLVVWTRDGQAAFYDLERGASHGTKSFELNESPDQWPSLLASLKDPKDRVLPFARIGGLSIWPLGGGKSITYYGRAKITLDPGDNAQPQELTFDIHPAAIAVDAETHLVAALDQKGALLLGKPGGTVKTIKPGLYPTDELPLSAAVARGGKRLVVSDGSRLVVIDNGKVTGRLDLYYACGLLALSPDGQRLMTFDADSGVLRLYTTGDLRLTHQRFVIDVLSGADELQLLAFAELPPVSASLNALTLDDQGRFAFAVFGQIGAASIAHLTPTDGSASASKNNSTAKPEAFAGATRAGSAAQSAAPKPSGQENAPIKPAAETGPISIAPKEGRS